MILQIVKQYLFLQSTANCCHALNQFQQLILVLGTADWPLKLFLQRLNTQGLEISSLWASCDEQLILEAIWPDLHRAWVEEELWAGCKEQDDQGQADWASKTQCLQACQKLGLEDSDPVI